jgi:amidophosphoribosyltransferase
LQKTTFLERLVEACEQLEGAYSLVVLTVDKLVALRDPYGFRPLVMGRKANGAIVFASETCALDLIDAVYEREVAPGEVIIVDRKEGVTGMCLLPKRQRKACVFEHIYFALPNSDVFGKSVYEQRYKYGRILGESMDFQIEIRCILIARNA